MQVRIPLVFQFLVLCWAFGCRKAVLDNTQNTGRDYFPLTRGSWWLYQVDTIFYNEFSGDTVLGSAELLERADTLIITDNGLTAMRLERYSRPLGATAWGAPRIWWATLTDRHALKSEENNIYAKLAFPLTPNASWNGNVYNIFPEQRYTVKSIDNPYSGPFLNFDSVCTVQQLFYEDLLQYRRYEEIFARRVGLVWKLEMDVAGSTQPADIGKHILDRIKGGVVRKYALKDYSIEP